MPLTDYKIFTLLIQKPYIRKYFLQVFFIDDLIDSFLCWERCGRALASSIDQLLLMLPQLTDLIYNCFALTQTYLNSIRILQRVKVFVRISFKFFAWSVFTYND